MELDKGKQLIAGPLKLIGLGIESIVEGAKEAGASVVEATFQPPAGGDPERMRALSKLFDPTLAEKIDAANQMALQRLLESRPTLIGVGVAREVIPGMSDDLILHAGPPITWERMAGPLKGAIIGGLIYEGKAKTPEEAEALAASGVEYRTLDEVLSTSDLLSLHCPLTDETYHLIDERQIGIMKKGVIVINTSRGALIDAEALLGGIKSRRIGGACLDVYEEESEVFFEDRSGHIIEDDTLARLISMPNVLVTSHQAFLTEEALEGIAKTTVENIVELFTTGRCQNQIPIPERGEIAQTRK